jgi:hypothetical protein
MGCGDGKISMSERVAWIAIESHKIWQNMAIFTYFHDFQWNINHDVEDFFHGKYVDGPSEAGLF